MEVQNNPQESPESICLRSSSKVTLARVLVKAVFAVLKDTLKSEAYFCQTVHQLILGPIIPEEIDLPICQLALLLLRGLMAKLFLLATLMWLQPQEIIIMKGKRLLLSMTRSPQGLCPWRRH